MKQTAADRRLYKAIYFTCSLTYMCLLKKSKVCNVVCWGIESMYLVMIPCFIILDISLLAAEVLWIIVMIKLIIRGIISDRLLVICHLWRECDTSKFKQAKVDNIHKVRFWHWFRTFYFTNSLKYVLIYIFLCRFW